MNEVEFKQALESGKSVKQIASGFSSTDRAYQTFATYAANRFAHDPRLSATPVTIQWRIVYRSRKANLLSLAMLPFLLLGDVHVFWTECLFTTHHYWPPSLAKAVLLKSRGFEVLRHLLFGGLVICTVALILASVLLIFSLVDRAAAARSGMVPYLWAGLAGLLIAIVALRKLRSMTYWLGLPAELKILALGEAHPLTIKGPRA